MLRGIQFPVLDRKRVELIIVIGQSDILREKEVRCDPPGPLQGTCYALGGRYTKMIGSFCLNNRNR